jgi:hypothetical protein
MPAKGNSDMKSLACTAIVLIACRYVSPAAADECCDGCKCQAPCCKVCRCVPTTKKVTKPVYHCECEDFCVPGPSTRCKVCDDCGQHHTVYTPNCAEVRTRKKLVKEIKTEEVKTYKWVVETLCPNCAEKCGAPDASVPASDGAAQARHDAQPANYESAASKAAPAVATAAAAPVARADEGLKSQIRRTLQPIFYGK